VEKSQEKGKEREQMTDRHIAMVALGLAAAWVIITGLFRAIAAFNRAMDIQEELDRD
jgi:amino acid permease